MLAWTEGTRDGEVDKNLTSGVGCWVLVVGDRDVVFVGRLWLGVQKTRYTCIIDACGVRLERDRNNERRKIRLLGNEMPTAYQAKCENFKVFYTPLVCL